MSSSRSTPTLMTSQMLRNYGKQFKAFAPKAWSTYNDESSSDWARAQARVFKHTVNKDIPFAVVYNGLLRFANIMLREQEAPRAQVMVVDLQAAVESDEEQDDEDYQEEDDEEDEDYVPRRSALQRDTDLVNAIVPEGRQTNAEEISARRELNRILYREYNNWFEAFEAEGDEDPYDDTTGTVRFIRHCAKVLGRRTGIRDELLESVVGAWLVQHHGLCPSQLEPAGDGWCISEHR